MEFILGFLKFSRDYRGISPAIFPSIPEEVLLGFFFENPPGILQGFLHSFMNSYWYSSRDCSQDSLRSFFPDCYRDFFIPTDGFPRSSQGFIQGFFQRFLLGFLQRFSSGTPQFLQRLLWNSPCGNSQDFSRDSTWDSSSDYSRDSTGDSSSDDYRGSLRDFFLEITPRILSLLQRLMQGLI